MHKENVFYSLIWSDHLSLLYILFIMGPAHSSWERMTGVYQCLEVEVTEGRLRRQPTAFHRTAGTRHFCISEFRVVS